MDKQQMLERIYDVIADKTLSFWCKVMWKGKPKYIGTNVNTVVTFTDSQVLHTAIDLKYSRLCTIIWHPVMIGDVLDWIYENDIDQVELHQLIERKWKDTNFTYTPSSVMVIALWKEKRKPIDDQSDECIKFIYSLLPQEWQKT